MAELGDKKKPSGAQNRKRKLEKEETIKKLTSPIDSFFRPGKFVLSVGTINKTSEVA